MNKVNSVSSSRDVYLIDSEVWLCIDSKALSLHKELLAEASSDAPPAGLLELLSTRLLWQEGGTDVPADTLDAPAAPARSAGASVGCAGLRLLSCARLRIAGGL